LGETEELIAASDLNIEPRTPSTGGFGKNFKARVFVDDMSEVALIAELLVSVSYSMTS